MQRWRRSTLVVLFHRWTAQTAVACKAKQQLFSCVRRLQQRVASMAFQGWHVRIATIRRQRFVLSRAIVRDFLAIYSHALTLGPSPYTQPHLSNFLCCSLRLGSHESGRCT